MPPGVVMDGAEAALAVLDHRVVVGELPEGPQSVPVGGLQRRGQVPVVGQLELGVAEDGVGRRRLPGLDERRAESGLRGGPVHRLERGPVRCQLVVIGPGGGIAADQFEHAGGLRGEADDPAGVAPIPLVAALDVVLEEADLVLPVQRGVLRRGDHHLGHRLLARIAVEISAQRQRRHTSDELAVSG
ncbi:hypothetical protein SDC9_179666 [bioreactor metagenome]|uniref:Uncharacterized protein n=1 Tax=bioreactor metagenome TaxID=1076179 RepID=A0A645H0H7_9ZZZZ